MNTPEELWRRAARGTTAGAVILDELGRVLVVKHNYGPLNSEIWVRYWPVDALPRPINDFTLALLCDTLEGVPKYSRPEVRGPSRACRPT